MSIRIGLMGGTFDPVHLGHLITAVAAYEQLDLEQIWMLPAASPPHKQGEHITEGEHRVEMLLRATNGDTRFRVRLDDMKATGPSYTADLLRSLTDSYPDYEWFFIIGEDSLRDFHTWHAPEEILKLCRLAATERPGIETDETTLDSVPGLRQNLVFFKAPQIDISSTSIRERVNNGKTIRYLVEPTVRRYILEHHLYSPDPM